MAEVLGTASNSAAAQQEVVAPQPQLSQRELEVKLEAAARASAAADANLARFLADHVPHHITAANASPAGIEGDSEPRAALMGGRQQHAHKANTAAAEGLSALQQATHAVKYIHEQHTSTAPQPELKPQTRRSWCPWKSLANPAAMLSCMMAGCAQTAAGAAASSRWS
ncbi:hypothetical protein OEZ85_013125 [Tetradesmus obliquus]|uniref:SMP domain-containing protein n=1 Tax=Tetradesmus obliquus TaxID=3088 RepID=A0ABY8U4Q4_TETOB|nr:hypothetical protein OEZ85_013125 [Tetradesmus obliquus]